MQDSLQSKKDHRKLSDFRGHRDRTQEDVDSRYKGTVEKISTGGAFYALLGGHGHVEIAYLLFISRTTPSPAVRPTLFAGLYLRWLKDFQ